VLDVWWLNINDSLLWRAIGQLFTEFFSFFLVFINKLIEGKTLKEVIQ